MDMSAEQANKILWENPINSTRSSGLCKLMKAMQTVSRKVKRSPDDRVEAVPLSISWNAISWSWGNAGSPHCSRQTVCRPDRE